MRYHGCQSDAIEVLAPLSLRNNIKKVILNFKSIVFANVKADSSSNLLGHSNTPRIMQIRLMLLEIQ
jgi:hypothetical protein